MMAKFIEIFCDETGHTGPDLLHPDQRVFGYGSVNISDDEAWQLIQEVKTDFRLQMPELKANKMVRTTNGRKAIERILNAVDNRYAVNVFDKLLALGGWFFEYIYEPVYKENPSLLYEKDLHRFVATFVWLWFNDDASADAQESITQFQKYMRTRNAGDAPFLFDNTEKIPPLDDGVHPFHMIQHFACGYRNKIIEDNKTLGHDLPDQGRWTLDLSAPALWSHLNYWGKKRIPLKVKCDASKPLHAITEHFTGDKNDPGIRRARLKDHKGHLGWKLVEPITFADSRNHPALQIADVIAGTAVGHLTIGYPDDFHGVIEHIHRHMLQDSILPELERVDLKQRKCAVNALILFDLAKRAQRQADPYYGLDEMYRQAEISWVQGRLRF